MAPLRVPQENGEWLNIDEEIARAGGGSVTKTDPIVIDAAAMAAWTTVPVAAVTGLSGIAIVVSAIATMDKHGDTITGTSDVVFSTDAGFNGTQQNVQLSGIDNTDTVTYLGEPGPPNVRTNAGINDGLYIWGSDDLTSENGSPILTVTLWYVVGPDGS